MDINNILQSALQYYQAGDLPQAEHICLDLLKQQAGNVRALNMLGIIYSRYENYGSAIKYFKRALKFASANANILSNLGHAYFEKGRLDEAVRYYQMALKIDPHLDSVHYRLGTIFRALGNLHEALISFQRALVYDPEMIEAHYNLGLILKERGSVNEAFDCFQKTIEIDPNFAEAYLQIGDIYREKKEINDAITQYQKAVQLNPYLPHAFNNLGIALQDERLFDESIEAYQKALELDPKYVTIWNNLGTAFMDKGQIDDAISCYQKAFKLDSKNIDSFNNLGTAYKEKGYIGKAIKYFQKAIKIDQAFAAAHYNLSLALLLTGDYEEGWKEFEWRWKVDGMLPLRNFHKPLWDGNSGTGLTILLHAEQGIGDTIQFIRYVPLVAQMGAKVIVECHGELASLLQHVQGIQQIVMHGEVLPEYDVYYPLMSLPLLFHTTLENIPAQVPYISIDSMMVRKWKKKVKPDKSLCKIGLVWSGSQRHRRDQFRSYNLDSFAVLAQTNNTEFYSLQKGPASLQAENPPIGMKLIDHTNNLYNFMDTAALIKNLDLVISADTAVAHLAGALGKPVWTLIPFSPDWRWLLKRTDSPWYPTMKLFRQTSQGDWASAIARVRTELEAFVSTRV